jgi:hypothetical protein
MVSANNFISWNIPSSLTELEPAFDSELGKHASFCFVKYRSGLKESLRQVNLMISFEDVLLCDER